MMPAGKDRQTGAVAQLVEQGVNTQCVGSNPIYPTETPKQKEINYEIDKKFLELSPYAKVPGGFIISEKIVVNFRRLVY